MIKVSSGLSRKVGGPHYSSRGGSVHFEQEFDDGAIHHPERLREGIDKLFALAREALEVELRAAGDQPKPAHQQHEVATQSEAEAEVEGAWEAPTDGDITIIPRRTKPQGPLASEKQVDYLATLCERQQRDLGDICLERYGVDLAWLTRREATELIGWLRRAPVVVR
jgi:hypothetical protein